MRTNRRSMRTFETLENRSMLAGNVVAAVDGGGNLTITGDAKSNIIYLAETASGGWRIQGLDTKINGHAKTFVTAPVTGNISVDMGDGNDQITMQDGRVLGNLSVQMGNGKNSMSLWNLDMALLNFDSGNLNDHVWIEHVVVANSGSAINTLGGKDSVTIRSFRAHRFARQFGGRKRFAVVQGWAGDRRSVAPNRYQRRRRSRFGEPRSCIHRHAAHRHGPRR